MGNLVPHLSPDDVQGILRLVDQYYGLRKLSSKAAWHRQSAGACVSSVRILSYRSWSATNPPVPHHGSSTFAARLGQPCKLSNSSCSSVIKGGGPNERTGIDLVRTRGHLPSTWESYETTRFAFPLQVRMCRAHYCLSPRRTPPQSNGSDNLELQL